MIIESDSHTYNKIQMSLSFYENIFCCCCEPTKFEFPLNVL